MSVNERRAAGRQRFREYYNEQDNAQRLAVRRLIARTEKGAMPNLSTLKRLEVSTDQINAIRKRVGKDPIDFDQFALPEVPSTVALTAKLSSTKQETRELQEELSVARNLMTKARQQLDAERTKVTEINKQTKGNLPLKTDVITTQDIRNYLWTNSSVVWWPKKLSNYTSATRRAAVWVILIM